MIFARTKSKLDAIAFVIRNIRRARKIIEIENRMEGNLLFRGYSASDEEAISEVYRKLNRGAVFSRLQRGLYCRIGRCCMLVVEELGPIGSSQIIGMNMYYLNNRDLQENTIHEGFIGVMPKNGGRGIATKMRKMAIHHFKSAGFSGISTRISLNNSASLMSAHKVGFQVVEKYQECSTGEQRLYMVCQF